MTVNIDVRVNGDYWQNPVDFQQQLEQVVDDQQVVLDFHAEGPSIRALGIDQVIDTWLKKTHRSPDSVTVSGWSNSVEQVPYRKIYCSDFSHFFGYSKNYWIPGVITPVRDRPMFGLFVGRHTIARNIIMYDVLHRWHDKFLISQMKNRSGNKWPPLHDQVINLEKIEQWLEADAIPVVKEWIQQTHIPSLDDKDVRDQYTVVEQSSAECNRSLLKYYDQFNIELVCETYTIGETFFPTEKTVRPLMAGKPMMIYGPVNFLKRLKKLGFRTWDTCWDESYDSMEGPQRWQAMKTQIDQVIAESSMEVLERAHDIAEHNRYQLARLIKL